MIVKFLIVVAVLVLAFCIVVLMQPDEFEVTRTAVMASPPEKAFAQVNNLKRWDAWSPWAKMDPDAKNSFEGPEEGVGAKMSWAGNSKVGIGSLTITESVPGSKVVMQLDFEKPMRATNITTFTFSPEGSGMTLVTWSMTGRGNFVSKAMGLIFNCKKMLGGQFDKGLASMKAIVEAP